MLKDILADLNFQKIIIIYIIIFKIIFKFKFSKEKKEV